MNKVFVFDLDDTLMDNMHDYAGPILDMARVIIRELGSKAPHVSMIIAKEEEIDKARVHEINPATGHEFLYSMERFPGSLVMTYRYFCKNAKMEPSKTVEQELYSVGMQAFDPVNYKNQVYPDYLSIIFFLYGQKDVPMLLSKGDKRVQSNKFSAINAGTHFFRSRIVDNKTSEIFKQMVTGFQSHCSWYSVGNDYDKDIVPALEAGFKGVWIPVETWECGGMIDEIRARVDWSRCIELKSLGELKERYGEL